MTRAIRDPEDTVDVLPADVAEAPSDLSDEFDREAPIEAAEADVVEQKLALDDDEDAYPEDR
jgi:hypothetical protein